MKVYEIKDEHRLRFNHVIMFVDFKGRVDGKPELNIVGQDYIVVGNGDKKKFPEKTFALLKYMLHDGSWQNKLKVILDIIKL